MKFLINFGIVLLLLASLAVWVMLPWYAVAAIAVALLLWLFLTQRGQQTLAVAGVGIAGLPQRWGASSVIVIGIALFPTYGATGIAAAIAVSGWFDALLLAVILARRGWLTLDPATPARLVRIVAATAVMALAVAGATAALAASIRPSARRIDSE